MKLDPPLLGGCGASRRLELQELTLGSNGLKFSLLIGAENFEIVIIPLRHWSHPASASPLYFTLLCPRDYADRRQVSVPPEITHPTGVAPGPVPGVQATDVTLRQYRQQGLFSPRA